MPVPFAHPVAILPFRRWCPKYLGLAPLVIGSLIPDLAACIDDWEYFSHGIIGSLVFCLPVGLLTLWIFYQVRTPIVSTFPNPHRDTLLHFCTTQPKSLFSVVVSLLLGAWIHIVWDLFTHDHSWLVRQAAVLSSPLAGFPVNRVLWLLSSIVGSGIILGMYFSLLLKTRSRWWPPSPADRRAYVLWFGIFLLPLAGAIPLTLHDRSPGSQLRFLAMYYLGCAYLTLALTGFLFQYVAPRFRDDTKR